MKQQVTFGLAMAAAMCGMALRADDEGWTKGPDFSFDTRAEKTIAGTAKMITYSSDGWGAGGSGVTVECSWEGGAAETLKEAADSGAFEWKPTVNGRYEFRHAVTDGTTETAVFVVNGLPGGEGYPWEIGTGVTAYVKDRILYLNGKGEVTEFGGDGAPWAVYNEKLTGIGPLSKGIDIPASVLATMPISVAGGTPAPEPPPEAVTTWTALTNAVATAESDAVIAVGADITEEGGELVVPAGKAVTIKLYGKTVTCGRVTVGGALSVGDADDSVGRIVASNGAKVAKGGSVSLLGGPMRGTFTTLSPGLILLFK